MAVQARDLVLYGSASMPDDDTATNIGGAVDKTTRVFFDDISPSGNVQVVSSSASDTTQSITVYGRNGTGDLINEAKTLNGTTVVPMTTNTTWERLLKAIKSATAVGDVAVEAVTATRSNTAQAGGTDTITLDAGASASDDTYNGQVIRLTGGTGSGQIAYIVDYIGSTKVATISKDWTTAPDATSTFKISPGMVFEKTPNEVDEVRRLFYNAEANPSGGATKTYYEKCFYTNNHATTTLTSAVVSEQADPSTVLDFDLESTLNGTDTNGASNNRQVAPGGYTFDSTNKNVANSQNHTAGNSQGIWFKLTLAAGTAPAKSTFTVREEGSSV